MKPDVDDRTARLERDISHLKRYAVGMTLAFAVVVLSAFKPAAERTRFGVIEVERINIVESDGTPRLVIANAARFPEPMYKGKEAKPGSRIVKPAGMIYLSADGSEMGGLALSDTKDGKVAAMLFDYDFGRNTSEATGIVRRIDTQGNASAVWMINDPPAIDADPTTVNSVDRSRIVLRNPDRNAEVLLNDAEGRQRIRLIVDKAGDARIEILDMQGKVVFRAPEAAAETAASG